jgi:LmbE family N-acetylglucosaminyl deacetylase
VLVQALVGSQDAAQRLSSTLVVVAHPDDEIIGAGSRLPLLREARFVYVSDGAPREGTDAARHGLSIDGYRQARRRELEAALGLCGIASDRVIDLGVPDQQTSFHLAEIARRLADLIQQWDVHAVLTQPYEGGHPDHDATAFGVHAAAALLRARGAATPEIVEMAGYHAGPHGPEAAVFLPHAHADAHAMTVSLDAAAQERKRALIACHATQRETLARFPLFVERFRPAPAYDFTRPPHAGPLHYEQYPWGMTGARFRELAAQALTELGLAGCV